MNRSYRGHFLVAGKHLRDSNFYKTVVLMVEHGPDGAMGLVTNRPSSVTVAHALSGHFNLPETDDVVFVGGPVEPSALFILHNGADLDETESPVMPGVFLGSSAEIFEEVVRAATTGGDVKFRIFSGCAGWAPGQLESEIARGDWYVLPASAELLCHEDPYDLYDLMLQRVYVANRLLPHMVKNPEWN